MSGPSLAPRLAPERCACERVVDAVVVDLRAAVAEARALTRGAVTRGRRDRRKVTVVVWVQDGKVLADAGGVSRVRRKPSDERVVSQFGKDRSG